MTLVFSVLVTGEGLVVGMWTGRTVVLLLQDMTCLPVCLVRSGEFFKGQSDVCQSDPAMFLKGNELHSNTEDAWI